MVNRKANFNKKEFGKKLIYYIIYIKNISK